MKKLFFLLLVTLFIERPGAVSQTVSSLPFGDSLLVTHKFPDSWEISCGFCGDTLDTIPRPHEKELNDVISYFNSLNAVKSIPLPQISKLDYIKLNAKEENIKNDILIASLDSCKYRLPNLGFYESYYSFNYSMIGSTNEGGYLILYNRALKSAKVLKIYLSNSDEISTSYRFFYFNKDKSLQIFHAYCGETEDNFKKAYIITFQKSGEVRINENK